MEENGHKEDSIAVYKLTIEKSMSISKKLEVL